MFLRKARLTSASTISSSASRGCRGKDAGFVLQVFMAQVRKFKVRSFMLWLSIMGTGLFEGWIALRVSCTVLEWNWLAGKFWPAGFATNNFWREFEGRVIGGVNTLMQGLSLCLSSHLDRRVAFLLLPSNLFYCCHSSVLKTHKIVFGLRDSDGSLSTHILFLGRLSLSMIRHQYLAYHFPTSSNTKSVALSLNKNVLTAGNAPGHLGNALASTTRNP